MDTRLPGRRGNKEGSIRQRADGKWEAAIRLDGRRYWMRGNTQADARRAIAEKRREHEAGVLVPPSRMTVGQHLESWLAVSSPDLRPKTRLDYEYVIRLYLVPAFGNIRLQRLAPPQVARQFAQWRTAERASGKTLLNVYRVLNRAMVVARYWGLVGANPLDGVEAPRAARPAISVWSQEEAASFLGKLDWAEWDSTLFTMLIATGCRFGEILGARWADFDRPAGVLTIRRILVTIHGAYVENDPKTEASKRPVLLPPFATDALRAWRVAQVEQRLAAGADWHDTDRIITLRDGASPPHGVAYNRFKGHCEAAGAPKTRMHDLRHLHASLLLAAGLPLPAVSARLGHASTAVTASIYSHALRGSDTAAAEAIQRSLRIG